jgi:hypothetical protein
MGGIYPLFWWGSMVECDKRPGLGLDRQGQQQLNQQTGDLRLEMEDSRVNNRRCRIGGIE